MIVIMATESGISAFQLIFYTEIYYNNNFFKKKIIFNNNTLKQFKISKLY